MRYVSHFVYLVASLALYGRDSILDVVKHTLYDISDLAKFLPPPNTSTKIYLNYLYAYYFQNYLCLIILINFYFPFTFIIYFIYLPNI
jgi:hypothetical protein